MTTDKTTKANYDTIPKWIYWYGAIIMVGAPLIFGIMTLMDSNIGMVTLEDGSTIDTGLFKYGIRNIAAAAITVLALYKRSAAMLLAIFIMRFIVEGGDLLDSILYAGLDTTSMLSYAAMMVFLAFVPYTLGIRKLWPMVH
ncbi:MAG: hypothetical protein RIG68_23190 [Imperialibacter sp.]|uniref:hypothetical protein n=1 Tax=Imperialibacter sp. TaxID=2038411 RepID=UPI0032F016F2